jgi:methionyl-tRNA formyltransferase
LDGKYPEDATAAREALLAAQADAMIVAAYGLILPQWTLDLPRLGCLNIHASLLPRWRGAAPIHRAIEAGDSQTGITIMQMDAGLDTGDMLWVRHETILPHDTTALLHDRLAALGGEAIVQALAALGDLPHQKQTAEGVTYAHKIDKAESRLDFTQSAEQVERQVRAFAPAPGAFFELEGERYRVLEADVVDGSGTPGTTVDDALTIACGEGAIYPLIVQRAGKPAMDTAALLRGRGIAAGISLA